MGRHAIRWCKHCACAAHVHEATVVWGANREVPMRTTCVRWGGEALETHTHTHTHTGGQAREGEREGRQRERERVGEERKRERVGEEEERQRERRERERERERERRK